MILPSSSIRPATVEDVGPLAELVNFAGEGLPLYLWTKMAKAGEDPWSVGRARSGPSQTYFDVGFSAVIDGKADVG